MGCTNTSGPGILLTSRSLQAFVATQTKLHHPPTNKNRWGTPWEITKRVFLAVFLLAMIGLLVENCRQAIVKTPRVEYEGKIVDRWAGFYEGSRGGGAYYRLLIEERNGAQTTVAVENEDYLRAKVGMWIKRDGRGVRFADQPSDFEKDPRN